MANECESAFLESIKGLMSKKEALALNDFIKDRRGPVDEIVEDLIKSKEVEMNSTRRAKLMTVLASKKVFKLADRFPKRPWVGLLAECDAIQSHLKNTRTGASRLQQVEHLKFFNHLDKALNDNGLFDNFMNMGDEASDISAEMFEPQSDSKPNVKKMASILSDFQGDIRKSLIKAGAQDLGKAKNYVMKTMHHPGRMRSPTGSFASDKKLQLQLMKEFNGDGQRVSEELRKIAFDNWRNTIYPELNVEKTFGNISEEKLDETLKEIYRSMSSGEYQLLSEKGSFIEPGSPFNLAKKIEAHKFFTFNDGRGWYRYQQKYGYGSFQNQILKQMWDSANQIGVMKKFGPYPESCFESVKEQLIAKYKDIPNIRNKFRKADNTFLEVMGRTSGIPNNLIGKALVALQSVRSLNLATIWPSSLPDFAMRGAKLKSFGGSYLESDFETANDLFNMGRGKELKRIGKKLGIYSDVTSGAALNRFTSVDSPFGDFARLNAFVYKYNFMEHHDFALGTGWAARAATELGGWADRTFDDLPVGPKRGLTIHGLEGKEWDLLRAPENQEKIVRNEFMVSAEMARDLTPKSIAKYLGKSEALLKPREIAETRDMMETKIINYLLDEQQDVIPTPSASTRAIINQGTRGDEFKGRLLRYLGQFKGWNIESMRRTYGRFIFGQGGDNLYDAFAGGHADILGMMEFMFNQMKWGYISAAAVNFSRGLLPPDPKDGRTWVEAADRGGIGSLFLGFLEQAMGKYNQSISSVSVPGLQPVQDVLDLVKSVATWNHPLFAATKLAERNFFVLDLFYANLAFKHLFLNGLMEKSKPGHLHSLEARAQAEGNKYYLKPSDHTNFF